MDKNVIKIALEKTIKYILLLVLLSILISYLTLETTMNVKYAIDGVLFNDYEIVPNYTEKLLNNNYIHDLFVFATIIIIINLIKMILNYLRDRITTKFKLKIHYNLKLKLYKHTLNLEYKSYNNYDKSEIMQRINEDANVYSEFFNKMFNLILDIIFLSIFIITQSVSINILVVFYIIITIIVILVFSFWYFNKLNKNLEELIYKRKRMLSATIKNISDFKLIRMFNKQKEEIENYKKLNDDYTKTDIKFIKLVLFYEIINEYIDYLNTPIIYIIGGLAVINGKMTIGSLSALISFTGKIFDCFLEFGANLETINDFCVVTKKINKFFKLDEEKQENREYDLDGEIIFSNVTIYIDKIPVLKNLNFIIRKGEKVAVIGENGTGKSIIIKTILGFYDYDGNIYINNHNIKRINKINIRKQIELIFGESYMFSSSILENITLGNNISKKEVIKVVKDCEIKEDIEKFKDKYNTLIGEKGAKLSGGQKQRIAIARSLINKKPIIILDEALNKVDNITKKKILDNLKQIYKNKTMILISNNLEIINYVDNIIYINENTTMYGKHEELLKRNKNYKNLIEINKDVI